MVKLFYYILGIICLVCEPNVQAQMALSSSKRSALKAYVEANEKLFTRQYELCHELLEKAIKKDNTFSEAYWLKADIYEQNRQYDKQIKILQKANTENYAYLDRTRVKLGRALFNEGAYGEALDVFMQLKQMDKINAAMRELSEREIEACHFALHLLDNPVSFQPKNLGQNLNTEYDDYWPVISADEKRLITTVLVAEKRGSQMHYQEDFYQSFKDKSGWSKSVPLGEPLNTRNNEGAQSLSPDGKVLFFSACNRAEGSGKCDIFISFYTADGWSEPINPGSPLNTSAWEAHPSLSSNGHTLYFCSNRPGGLGQRDIWQAELDFSIPGKVKILDVRNSGDIINTVNDEVSPYIHFDDKTLYYSSDGHSGLGRHDIFMCRKNDAQQWSKAINLGYPINTHRDEIGFTVNALGTFAYFASEADSGARKDKDIFEIPLPQALKPTPVSYLSGNIFNAENNLSLDASFELLDLNDGVLVSNSRSGNDGRFLLCLPAGKEYALNVSKDGYLFYSDRFMLKEQENVAEPVEKNIPLVPIKEGSHIELKNIFFEFDSYALSKKSDVELKKLVQLLKRNSKMVVEIGGHTDGKGAESYNKVLSGNRAESVKNYLVNAGIDGARLQTKGYGFTQPLDAENPFNAKNRRTELKVIGL